MLHTTLVNVSRSDGDHRLETRVFLEQPQRQINVEREREDGKDGVKQDDLAPGYNVDSAWPCRPLFLESLFRLL